MKYSKLFITKAPNPLSKQELLDNFEKMSKGDLEARKKIITHNIKLVLNQIYKKFFNTQYDNEELASIGLIGLIKAVDSFDIEKKVSFSSYAIRCINNEILMFMRKGNKYINDDSLDYIIHDDKDGNMQLLKEVIPDDIDIEEELCTKETCFIINKIVNQLPERDKLIIVLRYGLGNNKIHSQQQIADKLGISRTYVSRLESKAKLKIKNMLENFKYDIKVEKQKKLNNKLLIPEKNKIEGVNKKMGRRLKSIYEYFNEYSKEEIDYVITLLAEEDRKLLKDRYGEDSSNPVSSDNWTKEKNNRYYGLLLPKIKRLLAKQRKITTPKNVDEKAIIKEDVSTIKTNDKNSNNNQLNAICNYFKNKTKKEIQIMIPRLTDYEKELLKKAHGENWEEVLLNNSIDERKINLELHKKNDSSSKENLKVEELKTNNENKLTKEDYIKILDVMKTIKFTDMVNVLTEKEAIIICLRLGYVDGKYFTAESIAKFLGINIDEVTNSIKKVLLLYKENINTFIDQAIKETTNQELTFKKINSN